jgi:hypothetical protein
MKCESTRALKALIADNLQFYKHTMRSHMRRSMSPFEGGPNLIFVIFKGFGHIGLLICGFLKLWSGRIKDQYLFNRQFGAAPCWPIWVHCGRFRPIFSSCLVILGSYGASLGL